jgi:RHS repeat-associated protein
VPVAPYPDPAPGWGLSPTDPNTLPGDVETFTYDPATGQLETARNSAAQIARTYYPNGWLRTDSTHIATISGADFTAHRFGLTLVYDRDGRRTSLTSPLGSYQYSYSPGLGELTRLVNPFADTVKLAYDTLGRVNRMQTGNNRMTQLLAYDLDGSLTWDYVTSAGGAVPWPSSSGAIRSAGLTYTPDGRLARMTSSGRFGVALQNVYNTLGQLERSASTATSVSSSGSNLIDEAVSTFTHDPLGNQRSSGRGVIQSHYNGGGMLGVPRQMIGSGEVLTMTYANDGTGRLAAASSNSGAGATTVYTYDAAGNTRSSSLPWGIGRGGNDRVSYYDALDRLRVVESRTSAPPGNGGLPILLTLRDESRYDALGRRVLFTSRRKCMTSTWAELECRKGYVQRTVWDGDREVVEIRAPSADVYLAAWPDLPERDSGLPELPVHPFGDMVLDPNPYFGTVGYGYVGGVDRPVTVERRAYRDKWRPNLGPTIAPAATQPLFETSFTVFPQWNAQGVADIGSTRDGGRQHCVFVLNPVRCTAAVQWDATYWPTDPGIGVKWSWLGSLLENKRDPSGLLYRRHRYLDSQAGRFTQEDPIGLAGGLNAYNYAEGDPVNFEDPFGLCPEESGGNGATRTLADCPYGSKGWAVYRSGAVEPVDGPFSWFLGLGEVKAGISMAGAMFVLTRKSINLPAWKSIAIDMVHIASGHMTGGSRVSSLKTLFPEGMSSVQVERLIRHAYRNSKRVDSQGDRVLVRGEAGGLAIEMWVNRATRMIETAYPIGK